VNLRPWKAFLSDYLLLIYYYYYLHNEELCFGFLFELCVDMLARRMSGEGYARVFMAFSVDC
jgi:hypothetical protein